MINQPSVENSGLAVENNALAAATLPLMMNSPALTGQDSRLVICALLENLVTYDLKQNELLLVLMVAGDTFSRGQVRCWIDLSRWASRLGMRTDKLLPYWNELRKLGIIDANDGTGTCQIRPDLKQWSSLRGLRVPIAADKQQNNLALPSARPLSDGLSDLSLESVLAARAAVEVPGAVGDAAKDEGSQPARPDCLQDWENLKAKLGLARIEAGEGGAQIPDIRSQTDAADFSADPHPEKKAELRIAAPAEKSPGVTQAGQSTVKPSGNRAGQVPAEKSAALIASLTSELQKAKLASGGAPRPNAAARQEAAMRLILAADFGGLFAMKSRNARRFQGEWNLLCNRRPDFVLGRLVQRLENPDIQQQLGTGTWNPLPYLAMIAREEGMFRLSQAGHREARK